LFTFQISVNIGGDPSGISADSLTVNVQSPGMVSLNSVGTGSPVATPAPTPTPPIGVSTPQPNNENSSSKSDSNKEMSTGSTGREVKLHFETEKVIQELKPVPQTVDSLSRPLNSDQQFSASNDAKKLDVLPMQPSSPTKSFLTQFPVVKDKPAKSESCDRPPDKEISRLDHSKDKQPSSSAKQHDLSVFDFSDARSDNLLVYML